MKTPVEILRAVEQVGGKLEPSGDMLRALLPADCPPELKAAIRQHKGEILDLFQAQSANLPLDCAPWFHVARQVLAAEFDGADRSMIESLKIGLRSIRHPLCEKAVTRLQSAPAASNRSWRNPPQNPA